MAWRRTYCARRHTMTLLFRGEPSAGFPGDRQLLVVDGVVAGRHHLRVEGHLDHHGGERLRHEREDLRIVVGQVVAPAEGVVDAAAVKARDVALEIAGV